MNNDNQDYCLKLTPEDLRNKSDVGRELLYLVKVSDRPDGHILVGIHLRYEIRVMRQVLPRKIVLQLVLQHFLQFFHRKIHVVGACEPSGPSRRNCWWMLTLLLLRLHNLKRYYYEPYFYLWRSHKVYKRLNCSWRRGRSRLKFVSWETFVK